MNEAKSIVFANGPSNCIEFTDEILDKYGITEREYPKEVRDELFQEIHKQSDRVAKFLGF